MLANPMLRWSRLSMGYPDSSQTPRRSGDVVESHNLAVRPSTGEAGVLRSSSPRCIGCLTNPATAEKGNTLEVESASGGKDVWDAASAVEQSSYPEHLVIMVNGLGGSADDWKFAAEQFVKRLPDKVIVHRSECNSSKLTFDGVDLMGERLANEVLSVVEKRSGVRKISFVAHSLGGLIARYAIGKLYEHVKLDSSVSEEDGKALKGRIAGLEAMNFITFASPHLGSRGHRQLPMLFGLSFLERTATETAHLIVGTTGKHLFLTDNDDGKPPLLLRMVDDYGDIKFRSALRSFKRRVAYANANFDHMVGWSTSSIRRQHELPEHHLLVEDEKYCHIVHVDSSNGMANHEEAYTSAESHQDELEEEMIRGLTQVPWERVDVSFHKSMQRYVAHNTIQVKSYWLHSDGACVIFHMIDNFDI